jgi:3-hydroxyacyl-[acyl-carrier-protein] dehydratase
MDSVIADTAFASGEIWVGERRLATVDTLVATRRPVRQAA